MNLFMVLYRRVSFVIRMRFPNYQQSKMAYQTFHQEFMQIPVVTRVYTTSCVLTTAAVVCILCIFTRVNIQVVTFVKL